MTGPSMSTTSCVKNCGHSQRPMLPTPVSIKEPSRSDSNVKLRNFPGIESNRCNVRAALDRPAQRRSVQNPGPPLDPKDSCYRSVLCLALRPEGTITASPDSRGEQKESGFFLASSNGPLGHHQATQLALLQKAADHGILLDTDSDLIRSSGFIPCARPGVQPSEGRSSVPIPTFGTPDLYQTCSWLVLLRGGIPLFDKCGELPRECSESRG